MGFLKNRGNGALVKEVTSGTFVAPQQSDKTYPFGFDDIQVDANITEGFRSANGKFSEPRYFRGGVTATTTLMSYMTESVDPTVATGEFAFGDLLAFAGFRRDETQTNIRYIWDGQVNCETLSGSFVNLGCGTSTTGEGFELRGMRGDLQISAEQPGKQFNINCPVTAAVESYTESQTAIGGDFSLENDAVELFSGVFTFDGVAVPAETFSISLNNSQKTGRTPEAGKLGVSTIKTTDSRPKVSITAPIGSGTSNWWNNMITSKVINELTYVGTYYDITISDLSISGMPRTDSEGETAWTQELGFSSIIIAAK